MQRSDWLGRGQNGVQAAPSSRRPRRCGAAREVLWRVAVNRCGARQRATFWRDGERRPLAAPVQIACVPPVAPTNQSYRAAKDRSLSHFTMAVCEMVHNDLRPALSAAPWMIRLAGPASCSCSYSCSFGPVCVSGDGAGALSSGGVVVLSSGAGMHSPAHSFVPLTMPTSLQPIGAVGFT